MDTDSMHMDAAFAQMVASLALKDASLAQTVAVLAHMDAALAHIGGALALMDVTLAHMATPLTEIVASIITPKCGLSRQARSIRGRFEGFSWRCKQDMQLRISFWVAKCTEVACLSLKSTEVTLLL